MQDIKKRARKESIIFLDVDIPDDGNELLDKNFDPSACLDEIAELEAMDRQDALHMEELLFELPNICEDYF